MGESRVQNWRRDIWHNDTRLSDIIGLNSDAENNDAFISIDCAVVVMQGDQIGRNFKIWAIFQKPNMVR
jgi:hypothetical protein